MNRYSLLSMMVIAFLLGGCGFHLRGVGSHPSDVPEQIRTLYLKSKSPYAPFEQILRQNLRSYNINIIDKRAPHISILHIMSNNLNKTMGSVATNLQTRQYTLTYTVNYELLAANGAVILPPSSVMSMTTFTTNLSAMLMTTNSISQQYITSLQNDAAFRLINRLLAEDTKTALNAYYAKPVASKVTKNQS